MALHKISVEKGKTRKFRITQAQFSLLCHVLPACNIAGKVLVL